MRFPEVIDRYRHDREAIAADPKLRYKFGYLLAMNHLFLGLTDQARACLPDDLRRQANDNRSG